MNTNMQMLFRFLIIFEVCLLTIDAVNGNDLILTQEGLCSEDKSDPITHFEVDAAFKYREFIGIVGKMWKQRDPEGSAVTVALRVFYWHQPDPSGRSPGNWYDATVWNDIQKINKEKKINYAFSTRGVKVFEDQKAYELVFVVQEQNLTTAFQLDHKKVKNMSEPTYDERTDKKVVYDPKENWDDSGYLRIKYLFLHFPYEMKILAIMTFERKKIVFEVSWMRNITRTSPLIHHAIVYTEEEFGGKKYYFRHYMRTERHEYIDDKGIKFQSLDWFFDQNKLFCDEIPVPPTAVVMLSKEDEMYYLKETNAHKLMIHFVEFFGLKHKIMKITFPSVYSDEYTVEEDSGGQEIDNAVAFMNCKTHPISENPDPVVCTDYDQDSGDVNQIIYSKQFLGSDFDNTFIVFAVLIAIVMLLVLIGLLVMSIIKG